MFAVIHLILFSVGMCAFVLGILFGGIWLLEHA